MTAVARGDVPKGSGDPKGVRRSWAAYRRANWMLTGAGVTLTLAGVPANSPEVQAIRRALRAVNEASGLGRERNEVKHDRKARGPRYGRAPFGKSTG